jgi:hypothetical protein
MNANSDAVLRGKRMRTASPSLIDLRMLGVDADVPGPRFKRAAPAG